MTAPSFQALITAWDHLAQRLPKKAGAENAAGVILNALKLLFAVCNAEDTQRMTDGGGLPTSARMLTLALQLADLAAQVGAPPDVHDDCFTLAAAYHNAGACMLSKLTKVISQA